MSKCVFLYSFQGHQTSSIHVDFFHATNDCNVFHRQVQSAINDGRLVFTEGTKMKLDSDPFPINVVEFENKKMLIRSDQTESAREKMLLMIVLLQG